MEKIKKNIMHYLSRLNPYNDFNEIRKFAKKHDACDAQYDNFINLLKHKTPTDCWQFIMGNYHWLERNGYTTLTERYILHKAYYKSVEYHKNLIPCRLIDYYVGGKIKTYKAYDRSGRLEVLKHFDKDGLLYEEFVYYYDYYDRPRMYKSILKDDLYYVTYYDHKGNKKREYTTDLNHNYHGKYVSYYDESDIINIITNYDHGKFHGAFEDYAIDGKLIIRNVYVNGYMVKINQDVINSYLYDK